MLRRRWMLSTGAAVLAAAVVLGMLVTAVLVAVQRVQGAGATVAYRKITPAQLRSMLQRKDFTLINVHIPYAGEIEGTDVFVPYTDAGTRIPRLLPDRGARIVVYCQTGRMSAIAAETLVRLGHANVLDLEGGMVAWQQAGYPLITRRQ